MEQKAVARNADGSAGGGKGRFIESKVALPEEINSIYSSKHCQMEHLSCRAGCRL